MNKFTPYKKWEKIDSKSFIQVPRELLERDEYKTLTPNSILLFSILADRLELSFKQIDKNSKVKFYDDKDNMYVIFKRDEIQEKLHLKRAALDNAIALLKDCKLIQEKKQGKNLPTIGMIENEKILKFRSVENKQSGEYETGSPECLKSTVHNNYNNINKNNIYNYSSRNKNNYEGRNYKSEELEKLYANYN